MKLFAAVLLLLTTGAFAQQTEAAKKPRAVERKTEVTFEPGDAISGDIAGPNVETVTTVEPPKFKSLLKVRENFADKLMQSVSEL